jgi:hypothetical protein
VYRRLILAFLLLTFFSANRLQAIAADGDGGGLPPSIVKPNLNRGMRTHWQHASLSH